MSKESDIQANYEAAKARYADMGVDTDKALETLNSIPLSIHCWQGDDVGGFESTAELDGGLQVTGNYPGKARTIEELRQDFAKAVSLVPGPSRINLHAIYADYQGKIVDRDELSVDQFSGWIDWAKSLNLGVDFNPTFFSHPKANSGFTLSSADNGVREFWVNHAIACRKIADAMAKELGECSVNYWIPDGFKDMPADRLGPRERLRQSLDSIFSSDVDNDQVFEAIESKLFGVGAESYTVGSHDFYLGYAVANKKWICLDMGHFHPTESVADKISACSLFTEGILLHLSRGVRWDSDHVLVSNDELRDVTREVIHNGDLSKTRIALDFFDATINRVGAWVIGTRAARKALLAALLEPFQTIKQAELDSDLTSRLARLEARNEAPFSAVWEYCQLSNNIPVGLEWLEEVKAYERDVLSQRD